MKITLRDFGPISHFEFDLEKDLHVIFGKNNIGKSYAITAVYLILKNFAQPGRDSFDLEFFLSRRNHRPELSNHKSFGSFKFIDDTDKQVLQKIKSAKTEEIDITDDIEKIMNTIINEIFIKNLENSFKNSFSSIDQLSNKYSKKKFNIIFDYNEFIIDIGATDSNLIINEIRIKRSVIVKKALTNRKPLVVENKYIIYFNVKNSRLDLFADCINLLYFTFREDLSISINNVYFLPASRSGLYQALSTFSAVIAELSKSRNFLTNRIELPNISEAVSDYFLNLSNIAARSKNDFSELIENIEQNVLKGEVIFNKENKKLVFHQHNIDTDLDLSFTSSMVSEIAPIVAYLKYVIRTRSRVAQPNYGIIFIEEPEAHLHPEVQVKLMEMFAMLAGKNVKIVMTSHSNYMFNKLSNLVLEGKIDYNKVGSYLMRATDAGSVTDTLSMRAEADGMNDENFAGVAEMLYEERIKIYDKLNKEAENVD